jgi:exportin-7
MNVALMALEAFYHRPEAASAVLKFFCEFVQSRSQRIQFPTSSPNGILLFREASKILVTYGASASQYISLFI